MVDMYDCPECAFSYDMVHRVDLKGNVYPCPCCEEARLRAAMEEIRAEAERCYRIMGGDITESEANYGYPKIWRLAGSSTPDTEADDG